MDCSHCALRIRSQGLFFQGRDTLFQSVQRTLHVAGDSLEIGLTTAVNLKQYTVVAVKDIEHAAFDILNYLTAVNQYFALHMEVARHFLVAVSGCTTAMMGAAALVDIGHDVTLRVREGAKYILGIVDVKDALHHFYDGLLGETLYSILQHLILQEGYLV